MEEKEVVWYIGAKKDRSNDYYTINHDDLYDHIFVSRRTHIYSVKTVLKENIDLDFHFKFEKEKSPEDNLRLIDFVITDILSHIKPLGGK